MRFLLVAANNSLSHLAKALAAQQALVARGHEARIAVSRDRAPFLERLGEAHFILPDIQEADHAGLPTVAWFRKPERMVECIRAEVDLIGRYRPDRVLGVFRFTSKPAAELAAVPYDSLVCGCMLLECRDALGFVAGEVGAGQQLAYLEGFYRYAGAQSSKALRSLGLPAVRDVRELLSGERTLLWDFPEFLPLPARPGLQHVGPPFWRGWPYDPLDIETLRDDARPLAVVGFGTCIGCGAAVERVVRALLAAQYRVLFAAGGQKDLLAAVPADPAVTVCGFAPMHQILPHASLLVCHGGQLSVFEALRHSVPVVVMPFQPEQAHNGVCLERIGCGGRLVPPQPFLGDSLVFVRALERMTEDELGCRIRELTHGPEQGPRLEAARATIERYQRLDTLASVLAT